MNDFIKLLANDRNRMERLHGGQIKNIALSIGDDCSVATRMHSITGA